MGVITAENSFVLRYRSAILKIVSAGHIVASIVTHEGHSTGDKARRDGRRDLGDAPLIPSCLTTWHRTWPGSWSDKLIACHYILPTSIHKRLYPVAIAHNTGRVTIMSKFVVLTWLNNGDELVNETGKTTSKAGQQITQRNVIECVSWSEAKAMSNALNHGHNGMTRVWHENNVYRTAIAAIRTYDVMGKACYLDPDRTLDDLASQMADKPKEQDLFDDDDQFTTPHADKLTLEERIEADKEATRRAGR